jgi:transposase
VLRDFHQHLIRAKKPFKVAITAVMRKLLVHLNSLLKSVAKLTEQIGGQTYP